MRGFKLSLRASRGGGRVPALETGVVLGLGSFFSGVDTAFGLGGGDTFLDVD